MQEGLRHDWVSTVPQSVQRIAVIGTDTLATPACWLCKQTVHLFVSPWEIPFCAAARHDSNGLNWWWDGRGSGDCCRSSDRRQQEFHGGSRVKRQGAETTSGSTGSDQVRAGRVETGKRKKEESHRQGSTGPGCWKNCREVQSFNG